MPDRGEHIGSMAPLAISESSRQREAGRLLEVRDVPIAGIAIAHKATLAIHNTRHFEGTRITLIDPWSLKS